MTYKKTKMIEEAKVVIERERLFFVDDIIAFLPVSKSWWYKAFPVGGKVSDELKEILDNNKVVTKSAIRKKLYKSDKASELLSLYRQICTPQERQDLNQQYIDHKIAGKAVTGFNFIEPTVEDEEPKKKGKQVKLA